MANPTATILSASMMLDWLEQRSGIEAMAEAAARLSRAVDEVYASNAVKPYEFGGRDGTASIAAAVARNV